MNTGRIELHGNFLIATNKWEVNAFMITYEDKWRIRAALYLLKEE